MFIYFHYVHLTSAFFNWESSLFVAKYISNDMDDPGVEIFFLDWYRISCHFNIFTF